MKYIPIVIIYCLITACTSSRELNKTGPNSYTLIVADSGLTENKVRSTAIRYAEEKCEKSYNVTTVEHAYGMTYRAEFECFDPVEKERLAEAARKEAIAEAYQDPKILVADCHNNSNIESCEYLISGDFSGVNPNDMRKTFALFCFDDESLDSFKCRSWSAWEQIEGSKGRAAEPLRIGCKYNDGLSCLDLYSLYKKQKNKKLSKSFDKASEILKMECASGMMESCMGLEQLGDSCNSSKIKCKKLKLFVMKIKRDMRKQYAQEQERRRNRQEELNILRERNAIGRQQAKALERANWIERMRDMKDAWNDPVRTTCKRNVLEAGTVECTSH